MLLVVVVLRLRQGLRRRSQGGYLRLRKGGRLSEQFGLQMIDQITIQGDGFGQELMQGLFQVLNRLLLLLLLHGRRLKRERERASE